MEGKTALVARGPALHFPHMARLCCLATLALITGKLLETPVPPHIALFAVSVLRMRPLVREHVDGDNRKDGSGRQRRCNDQ
jgi:hypothetical protein